MITEKKTLSAAWTIGALIACAAYAAHGVTVVHDAAHDLVLNAANKNVYTNLYGGVWSYMRSATYNGERMLLPGVRYRTDTEADSSGLKVHWERGPAKNDASPCFSVNPTPWPDTKTFMRGSAYPAIQPGELSCHPGNTSDAGYQCIALRFTVPRDGTYTVTAKAWNRNTGWTAVALFVNGTERCERKAWKSAATAVTTNDFSLATATYAAGDTIEMSIDGNGTFNSNATGLDFRIEEEVEAVYDASSAFLANFNSETASNPYTDSFGVWSASHAAGISTNAARTLMNNTHYTRTGNGGVMAGIATGSGLPYVTANITGAMSTETNSTGKALTAYGWAFLPGELNLVPPYNNKMGLAILEIRPNVGGIFDVGIAMRDLAYKKSNLENSGANVWLLQGGEVLDKAYVTVERGSPYSSSATIFLKDVRVMPQIPLSVVVDNNGNNDSDWTATLWAFIRKGDFSATYDANAAMKANMSSDSPANPFSHNGITWAAGLCVGGWKGAFTAYETLQSKFTDTTKGWGVNANTSPYMTVNIAERTVTASEMGSGSVCDAGADMLICHPKSDNSATALRFTAPEYGVYSATAWFSDLSYKTDSVVSYDNGVDAHIVAEGYNADSAVLKLEKNRTGQEARRLHADRLFLRTGETVTFAVGSNGAYDYDLTGFYAWLEPDGDASIAECISIDLNRKGTDMTYKGAGRVWYSNGKWNGFSVEDGTVNQESRQLYAASGARTGATLSLWKENGEFSVSADNMAMDTDAAELFADGVISANSTDENAFTMAGLLPETKYELYFFSRALTSAPPATSNSIVRGVFSIGGETAVSGNTWFVAEFGDYARIDAISDAEGTINGTFFSESADEAAFWCGLQILGPGFSPHIPEATIIFIR